jgi:hypothetical protein
MQCPGLTTSKVVLLKSCWARLQTSDEVYTATLYCASLEPLDRREANCWSPALGGRTIANVSVCMPDLRYQASSFNAIRCAERVCPIRVRRVGEII